MRRGLRRLLRIVASIALPFAAPAIAKAIGLSSAIGSALGSATVGSTVGSALTGAALGAAKGAAFGEDIRRSALYGAIGSGIGGYFYGGSAAAPSGASSPYDLTAGGTPRLGTGLVSTGGVSPYSLTAGGTPSLGTGLVSTARASPYSLTAGGVPTLNAMASSAGSASPTFGDILRRTGREIWSRVSDPKALADITLRAAGQLASGVLAGSGLSPQEQELLNQQVAELRQLRETNQELFRQRLEQAMNLIGESRYFDPEYFGLQRARQVQIAGAQAKAAGLRGLRDAERDAEARRYDLAIARDTGTAFDAGFGTGVSGRLNTLQAGLQFMPTSGPSTMDAYSRMLQTYDTADRRRQQRAADIGSLFGSITGRR